ncbi:ABC transporter substrate-binding protein [Limimaricola pyoseonensis]|uniref:NitT/TauT family transport system ATP-binding protein n=1 Tax=Limimaricola pyoseonensis TaxID=521013 RepID=A0A1G7HJ42_9RHOB|nr:ABC transporter substrate-binding protein [Limimaricola pyoseonensis]SDF00502.1 NitT/TauT family transport system ATP-binding protein [Limimaricola pyoseonensis]
MSLPRLSVGFMPLVDAAPVIVAREMGFARAEGLAIELHRAPSWSSLRDMLAFEAVDAAQMLSPVPVATALGLGGAGVPLQALSVLSVNGNVIGVSRELAARLRGAGHGFGFDDARAAGEALFAVRDAPLRVGVPFPFSMHFELIRYWLDAVAPGRAVEIRTVPPPLMAEAIGAGEIDAFCVGEPWGSIAVETGVGELLLPGRAIWAGAPEKVLAVRAGRAEAEPARFGALVRALWRAGRWLGQPGSRTTAAELLSRPEYLNVPAEIIDRALTGRLTISGRGEGRHVEGLVAFHGGAAGFPWRSQAAWIGRRMAARAGLDPQAADAAARAVFRSDLHRQMLSGIGAVLPGASEKIEGAVESDRPVAAEDGTLVLRRDRFFDGRVFDPSRPD